MRSFIKAWLTASLLAATAAQAWTYQDGDALLVFRESGFNDVEFDLGPVAQFLNHSNGYSAVVTNWDLTLVTGVFGSDLTGVSVIVAATTSPTNATHASWLSSAIPNTSAYEVTPSVWQGSLWSTINSIGSRPVIYNAPTSGTSDYSIDPGGSYRIASYDQIVSQNGVNASSIAQFGGNSKFTVEGVAPGSFYLYAIEPSTANPKPPDSFVGTFSITTAGQLTFVAGPPAPTIAGIAAAPGAEAVAFNTVIGASYSLASTSQLGTPASQWPIVSVPFAGNGTTVTLTDTNAESAAFYTVIVTP